MGMFLRTPLTYGKADHLIKQHNAMALISMPLFSEIPPTDYLVAVLATLAYEVAGVLYDENEYCAVADVLRTCNAQHVTFLLIDKNIATSIMI